MPIITLIGLKSGAAYNICVEAEVCEFREYRNKTQCNFFVTSKYKNAKTGSYKLTVESTVLEFTYLSDVDNINRA